MVRNTYFISLLFISLSLFFSSCSDEKTYAELLSDEKDAISAFVKSQGIVAQYVNESALEEYKDDATDWAAGTKHFEEGQWYRFENGLYMRINDYGTQSEMFASTKNGAFIAVRFENCYDLKQFEDMDTAHSSNMGENDRPWLINSWIPKYSGSTLGVGLEFPINFVGEYADVSLILPSKIGPTDYIATVIPYYYGNIYYKSNNQ